MRRRWLAIGMVGIAVAVGLFLLRDRGTLDLDRPNREPEPALPSASDAATATGRTSESRPTTAPDRSSESLSSTERRPDERRTLSGVVRNLRGEPVPDALVELTERDHPEFSGTATTDASGRYRIDRWPSELELLELRDDFDARLRVTADTYFPLDLRVAFEIELGLPGDRELDLWLSRGAALAGRITRHEDGAPVAGALVELRRGPGHPILEHVLTSTSTEVDGRYALAPIPSRNVHASTYLASFQPRPAIAQLVVRAPGFATFTQQVAALDEGATLALDVALVRIGGIRGRVVDPEGRPHDGARVGLFGMTSGHLADYAEHLRPYATTNEDGTYVLDDVPICAVPEGYVLRAWTEFSPGSQAADGEPIRVVVAPGQTIDVPDLVVPRLPAIVANVADDAGRPIPGATVAGGDGGMTPTDARGRARILASSTQPRRVRADADGYVSKLSEPVEPRAFDPPVVSLQLERSHVIRGRVCYRDGTPAPEVLVVALDGSLDAAAAKDASVSRELTDLPKRWSEDFSRAGGWFRLEGLASKTCHVAVVRWRYYPEPQQLLAFQADVAADGPPLEITIDEESPPAPPESTTGTVTVHVRDEGRPVLAVESLVLSSATGGAFGASIEGPGHVQFDRVPFGTWTLAGRVPDHAPFELEVVLSKSEPRREVEVDLAPAARFTGRIRDLAALSALRTWISAQGPEGIASEGRVDAEGAFVLPDLRPGAAYRLELRTVDPRNVFWDWIPVDPTPIVATAGTVELGVIEFVRGASVRFEVVRGSSDAADARLEIVPRSLGRGIVLTPKAFPITVVVPEGEIDVTLTCSEGIFTATTTTATVSSGRENVVTFAKVP